MSRAADTRERLLESAQSLFAREGIYQVPLRRIVEGAGQRNASALHYHFGGRDGLLHAIIVRHDQRIRAEHHEVLVRLEADGAMGDARRLVEAMVLPMSKELATADGREYLQIVSQLAVLFDDWDVDLPRGPTDTQRIFQAIANCVPGIDPKLGHLRMTTLLVLAVEALAARARRLDNPSGVLLDHDAFITNLVDMALGALVAPSRVERQAAELVPSVNPPSC